MALPQVCPVATGSGPGEGGGVLQSYGPGQELPVACGCCWCFPPGPAHGCSHPLAHTLALFVGPQGLLPRAAPLSACPLLRLPPPLPRGTWASCWRVDFSSLCKQVVAACQVGRRQAGAALQPGCAKHRGTAWGGDGETPRERERESETFRCRQTDPRKPCWAQIEVETGNRK